MRPGTISPTMNSPLRLLSLFDYSGNWSKPFADGGWETISWDIKLSEFMDINLIDSAETALELFEDVDGIIAAPPCTDFTLSGAQYWKIKDEDGRTWKSVELVRQVERLVDLFRPTDPDYDGVFFWAMENPVGRLPKLVPGIGPAWYFDPFEFAGWLKPSRRDLRELDRIRLKNGIDVTTEEATLITRSNAYKKKTGLWGEFNRNMVKKPIPPVKACPQGSPVQRKGGNSSKDQEQRSVTPLAFATAFYEANKNYRMVI
jgi:hypothetical protein